MPSRETYHLTWTCYGQWLPGDDRGWVDVGHRTPGAPYEPADPRFRTAAANRMTETACWLADAQRAAAEEAVEEACTFRGWRLLSVNAQPDHVHVVVDAPEVDGKRVRHVLKDRATRALQGTEECRRHWWTEGGKIERVRDDAHLRNVLAYVERQPFPRVRRRM